MERVKKSMVYDGQPTLKELKKLSMQAMLIFAALNSKKLAGLTWKTQPGVKNQNDKLQRTFSPI
ncbi:hypothetical protein [Psychrobacillus sp. FSL K6-2843]|uniref:hypothetical protein n=1 Tax=Psychrobacillus sp. FSL K6-2843 TaxID=2921549 RepID=UPI00315AD621